MTTDTEAEQDVVTVLCWNVEHNGHDLKDGSDHRRHRAYDILAEHKPDLVFRQELTGADADGGRELYEEGNRLGLSAYMAPVTPESRNPNGVFLSNELFQVEALYAPAPAGRAFCNPLVRLKDRAGRPSAQALSLASVHLSFYDPASRAREAKRLTALGSPGRVALIGGDMNSYPHTEMELAALPDWQHTADASHFEHRTIERDGRRVPDTLPDEILAGGHQVFIEAGHYAATTLPLKQPGALDPTASLWRKDQGPMQRIDRIYFSPVLAPALLSFEAIADDDIREVSDHALLKATFGRDAFFRALTPAA
ncbi:endonuclease/exonuclease/phosphatase family protein [Streptomyces sp. RKAG337]|uniref:endonuclease/exonuclease/phosphatase family protein n=1 Tax=Streptomyces sp. RKAG337 TaxID=2893404 RepID=UPI00203342A1|nr:endonuclease/exonuclease/phosphatase family protein [Streptomyces sp. RKAG337]MCM2431029.1 endonuclease/exonuclease/phosphatase family protein [Streptomyces sp. RKAG337]